MARGAIAGSLALACCLLVLLGVGESVRPGFLALDQASGWQTLLIVLIPCLMVGAVIGFALSRRLAGAAQGIAKVFILILAAVVLVGLFSSRRQGWSAPPSSDWRIIVLGIDGGTWDVLEPGIEKGDLPNFSRLVREGAAGVLLSEEPTLSPRVWTTIASGVGPDKHGAIDFLATSGSVRAARIWEIAQREGGTIGMFGWLLTWPPGRPNGFIVPGWMAEGPETWPEGLSFLQKLRRGKGERSSVVQLISPAWDAFFHGATLPTLVEAVSVKLWILVTRPDDLHSTPKTLLLQGDMSSDVFLHWLAKTSPDLSALILYAVDTFSHRYWRDFEPEAFGSESTDHGSAFANVIPEAYEQADKILGRLMKVADDQTVLVVISDHGTGPSRTSAIKHSLRSVVLDEILDTILPVEVFSVTDELVARPSDSASTEVELDRLVEVLNSASVDGEPFLRVSRESGFISVSLMRNVDVSHTATIGGIEIPLARLVVESNFSGSHRPEGVIGVWGRPIRAGMRVEGATIRDVAPTILALMGYPISREMDGKVLSQVLEEPFRSALEIEWIDSYGDFEPGEVEESSPEEEEALRKRLEALGYIQ